MAACKIFGGQLEKDLDLTIDIYADKDYVDIVKKTDLHDKMKKIISKHRLVTGSEIDFFTRPIYRPELEEILNDYKNNEDIRNIMKKYGAAENIMPHLIYMEFFGVNENLIKQKEH